MEASILKFSRKAVCIGLIYSSLVSCSTDPQPNTLTPVLLQTIPIKFKSIAVNRDIIAVVSDDGYLKLFKQDPVNPDLLKKCGSIDENFSYGSIAILNSQWATFISIGQGVCGIDNVVLVDVSDPYNPLWTASLAEDDILGPLAACDEIRYAVAYENYLLLLVWEAVTGKHRALLMDILNPTDPVLKRNYELTEFPSSVFALESGFFMATLNGYAYMDVSDPINILLKEGINEDLASTGGFLEGDKLFFASSNSNNTVKIGRFDLNIPESPVLETISHSIDVDPQGLRFGYDGVNHEYYIKEIDSIKVYKETNGIFGLQKAVKFKKDDQLYGLFYVWNGRIYTSRFDENLYVYKMPD